LEVELDAIDINC